MIKYNIIILLFFLFSPLTLFAGWQEDLEAHFDKVSTFDELQDWHGGSWGESTSTSTSDSQYLPKKLDGSNSLWTYGIATKDGSYDSNGGEWVGTRDADYTWKSGPKNLVLNYVNLAPDGGGCEIREGLGVSRLETFIGDFTSPQTGYDVVHLFFMMKFHDGFFRRTDDDSAWSYINGYLKFMQFSTGFTDVEYYGSYDQHQVLCADDPQTLSVYGLNFTIMNITGGGLSNANRLFFVENTQTPILVDGREAINGDPDCWKYDSAYHPGIQYRDTDFDDFYVNHQWFGVEVIIDQGTINTADGSVTVKVYDNQGNLVASESETHDFILLKKDDNRYNRIGIGGNMSIAPDGGENTCTPENRIYIDDFIIDGDEIAPTYFALLEGELGDGGGNLGAGTGLVGAGTGAFQRRQ